jgi:hypothetical protein
MIRRTQIKRSAPPPKRRKGGPRRGPLRDPGYLAFIRQLACLVCNRFGCEAAHGPVNGMSSKGPDNEAVPLCSHHHRDVHILGWPALESIYQFSRAEIAKYCYSVYQERKR